MAVHDHAAISHALRGILLELELEWATKSGEILGDVLCGRIKSEDLGERLVEIFEDLEDDARERAIQALDGCVDFSMSPGGTLGELLEEVDAVAWGALLDGIGPVARAIFLWVKGLRANDLSPALRAARLERRAAELEMKARGTFAWRAGLLRRRAEAKRKRAAALTVA